MWGVREAFGKEPMASVPLGGGTGSRDTEQPVQRRRSTTGNRLLRESQLFSSVSLFGGSSHFLV